MSQPRWVAARAALGLASKATAHPKMVPRTRCSSRTRSSRQYPARLPYSKNDSFARSRSCGGTGEGASPMLSREACPVSFRFSEPSS